MSHNPEQITFFAKTDARGKYVPFGIKAKDRTRHVYVIGKTGMGKSTLLENMAVQDIRNGNGLAFIDPHGQTAEKLLEYIPEERAKDVLYFAPFDMEYPVSFNVMEDVGPDKRHLVVSGLMSVFAKIWVDQWSARMEYILSNTLLALLEYPDSTLLSVNRMLSDKAYRDKVVDNVTDPSVKSFWIDEFGKYTERFAAEATPAIQNKIGQFTANPLIRNIIGQPRSSFDIRKIMDERKILIMNLSKGLVGETNANLLGSMLTTRIYLAAMSRADLPVAQMEQMPNFYFYVDEFQSFANSTFANILSEARKYKLNLTIAHQYIEQMEEEVRNAVFGNVGTVIAFRVGPFDAEVLETIFSPRFLAADIVNLGFAQIYLSLMIDGIGSAPFSAVTLPPLEPESVSYREIILDMSRKQFASDRADVEQMINAWHEDGRTPPPPPKSSTAKQGKRPSTTSGGGAGAPRRREADSSGNAVPQPASEKETFRSQRAASSPPSRSQQPVRGQNGGNNRPPQNSMRELSELRSVLGTIAGGRDAEHAGTTTDGGKDKTGDSNAGASRSTRNNQQVPKNREAREKHNGGRKLESSQKDKSTDNKNDLRNALSSVLAQHTAQQPKVTESKPAVAPVQEPKEQHSAKNEQRRTTQQSQENEQSQQRSTLPQKSTDTNESIQPKKLKEQGGQTTSQQQLTETPLPPPDDTSPVPPQDTQRERGSDFAHGQEETGPNSIESMEQSKNKLDPKQLERMMRVTTSDKSPLK